MGSKSKRFISVFLLTVLGFSSAFASVVRHFDEEKLGHYRQMEKYDYDRKIAAFEVGPFLNFFMNLFEFLGTGVGFVILLLLAGGLIFLLVYFISRSKNAGTINDNELDDVLIEDIEDIQFLDLDAWLEEAIQRRNYRLATRILYLQVLRSLNDKKLIEWKNEKTNYDYIREIRSADLRSKLDRVTYVYEYTWYGEASLDESKYTSLAAEFKELKTQIVKS